jgi:hypothetical protein
MAKKQNESLAVQCGCSVCRNVCEMDAQGAKMPGGRLGTCLALLVHQLILCM